MKTATRFTAVFLTIGSLVFGSVSSRAQAIDPNRSAKAAVASDAKLITTSIDNNEYMMYLSQQAMTRGTDMRVKELAEQMLNDHTSMLYSMEQLASAGTG